MAQNLDTFTYELTNNLIEIDSQNGLKSLSVLCPIRSTGNVTLLGKKRIAIGGIMTASEKITLVPGEFVTVSGYNLDIGGIEIDATGSGTIATILAT